jgi:hypothetical protein
LHAEAVRYIFPGSWEIKNENPGSFVSKRFILSRDQV